MPNADYSLYSDNFYASIASYSYAAAIKMLSCIQENYAFISMVDIGCGSGTWLSAARNILQSHGELDSRLVGIDGAYTRDIVDKSVARYIFQDLQESISVNEKFDLAISLEVAEHLSSARARSFVAEICAMSDVVLFGAAIPLQGGQNHLNEQWQQYWAEMFALEGYGCFDVVRPKFWMDPFFSTCPWYVSNTLLYIRQGHPLAQALAASEIRALWQLNLVHPTTYLANHYKFVGFRGAITTLPAKFLRAMRKRLANPDRSRDEDRQNRVK